MSSALVARRLGQLVSLIVLVSSGAYLLVYLYRWEWNRAVVAGIFFIAAEVAIAAAAILRRLRTLDARVEALAARPADAVVAERIREAAPEPRPVFAWLDEQARTTNVFVPVLLGAGVVLSVLAAAVERLASATTVPVLEDRLARRLGALALPDGGLLGVGPATPSITQLDHRPPARRLDRIALRAFAVAAGGLLLVSAIDLLADATQDRPDPPATGSAAVTLDVDLRFSSRSVTRTAEALFVACRSTIGDGTTLDLVREAGPGLVTIVLTPAFGEHGQRRLVGCLEDATFDRVSADVLRVERLPAP